MLTVSSSPTAIPTPPLPYDTRPYVTLPYDTRPCVTLPYDTTPYAVLHYNVMPCTVTLPHNPVIQCTIGVHVYEDELICVVVINGFG